MDIMDPFTAELLSAPPLPGQTTEFDDDYLRAIGALPRRPSADFAPASSVDHPVMPFAAAHVIPPAVEVPVPPRHPVPRKRAAPVSDAAASNGSAKRRQTCPWVPDYDVDIDLNLREKEMNVTLRPSPDYLRTVQGDRMDEQARANLVVWLDELARHHRLAPGTLHRAVSYVDRVLSARALSTAHELRLLGAAAVFTAAKYEQRSAILELNAADVAGYCGFATGKEVVDVEREMLATLRYEIGGPTAYTFVEHFTRNSRGEKNMEIRRLAHRLADTSLVEYGCLRFMPSAVAAAALFLARVVLGADNRYFDELTGYNPMDLIDGIRRLQPLPDDMAGGGYRGRSNLQGDPT
ncbi:unnamed protein product [Alopecurus aequalis]